jgi:hypothetical protein
MWNLDNLAHADLAEGLRGDNQSGDTEWHLSNVTFSLGCISELNLSIDQLAALAAAKRAHDAVELAIAELDESLLRLASKLG